MSTKEKDLKNETQSCSTASCSTEAKKDAQEAGLRVTPVETKQAQEKSEKKAGSCGC